MRIPDLRKKIIINLSISGVLFVAFAGVVNFYFHQETNVQEKVAKINSEISQIQNQTSELENKTAEVAKYTTIWKGMSPNRIAASGIKLDEFNTKLTAVSEKYSITNVNLKISVPEVLNEGIFKRESVEILFSPVSITFNALSDIRAISFLNEFIESLQGYPVVTSFELKKTKDYADQDLENISSGKGVGVVSGKIDFFWYVLKESQAAIDAKKAKNNDNK
jgi:hypothetical protein